MSELKPLTHVSLKMHAYALLLEGLKLIGIALGCLVVVGLTVWLSVRTGTAIPARWVGLVYWTGFLAWVILRQFEFESESRHLKFWAAIVFLLGIHVVVFARVLEKYPNWRMAWFPLIAIIETPCMVVLLQPMIDKKHRRWKRK